RVQRTEDQVSRQRRLDGELRRLVIEDLADEDDVGRLPQHGPDDAGEIQTDLVLHFHLVDARQVVLDGVFRRDDLPIRTVQFVQGAVQGRRLAGAGRAGDQEDAVGPLDDLL